jgi:hypothetical protein
LSSSSFFSTSFFEVEEDDLVLTFVSAEGIACSGVAATVIAVTLFLALTFFFFGGEGVLEDDGESDLSECGEEGSATFVGGGSTVVVAVVVTVI